MDPGRQFEGTSLADAPALRVVEAESTTPDTVDPKELTFVRRLRAWLITPLAQTLAAVPVDQVIAEALEWWRITLPVWRETAPALNQLLIRRGALAASPAAVVDSLESGLSDPSDLLPNLPPAARAYLRAYQAVLEEFLRRDHDDVVEGVRRVTEGPTLDVVDLPELQAYFALCQAVAVAGLEREVPAAAVEVLSAALWQTFRDLTQADLSPEVFDAALERARHEAEVRPYEGPAISRWRRRRGGGPKGMRMGNDFDHPLPEFDDD